jgi:hypothetical protein
VQRLGIAYDRAMTNEGVIGYYDRHPMSEWQILQSLARQEKRPTLWPGSCDPVEDARSLTDVCARTSYQGKG